MLQSRKSILRTLMIGSIGLGLTSLLFLFVNCRNTGFVSDPGLAFNFNTIDAYQDVAFTQTVSALRGSSVTFSNKPSWLSFDPATGNLFGRPTDPGTIANFYGTYSSSGGPIKTWGPYQLIVHGDPLKSNQWHLKNTGQTAFTQSGGTAGVDINTANTIASGLTGNGVRVVVSDTGVDTAHEDLAANVLASLGRAYDSTTGPWSNLDANPTGAVGDSHGTAVAGLIGAIGWNGVGGRGVAPKVKIIPFRVMDATGSSLPGIGVSAGFVDQATGDYDIYNYSWGAQQNLFTDADPNYITQLSYAVTNYRGGKGSIYVKAAGNQYGASTDPNIALSSMENQNIVAAPSSSATTSSYVPFLGNPSTDGENAYPYLILTGAINADGKSAAYSTRGSALWISAPGGMFGYYKPAMVTTDISGCVRGDLSDSSLPSAYTFASGHDPLNLSCNYTNLMNGTSSATPVVVGAIALMLEANPNLTWRDVKHILASTANHSLPTNGDTYNHPWTTTAKSYNLSGYLYELDWRTNGAGYHFHNAYGFGLVDVDAAVTMAKSYTSSLGTFTSATTSSASLNLAVPDNSSTGVTTTLSVSSSLTIEAVQVTLNHSHPNPSDLGVELTSPSGMISKLMTINSGIGVNTAQGSSANQSFLLLSNAFYGESSSGTWTLKVVDGMSANTGTLKSWSLKIYGH